MAELPVELDGGEDEPLPIFRPSKRQKIIRKRKTSPSPPPDNLTPSPLLADAGTSEDGAPSVTEILRRRQALQQRRKGRGIDASANSSAAAPENNGDGDAEAQEPGTTDLVTHNKDTNTISSRFAPQTGQIKEVMDKHMTAYIESQLAKQRREASAHILPHPLHPKTAPTTTASHTLSTTSPPNHNHNNNSNADHNQAASPSLSTSSYSSSSRSRSASPEPNPQQSHPTSSLPLPTQRNPASLGKLQEIDLGPSARLRNEAATLLAAQHLASSDPTNHPPHLPLLPQENKKRRRPRIRLDKKGRPLPPRPPKKPRRTSEDKARDRLVEEMLRENRMDIAAATALAVERSQTNAGNGVGKDGRATGRKGERGDEVGTADVDVDADARMAEEFRREYLDAQAAGRRQPPGGAKEKEKEGEKKEGGRGPKLGGSRSTRAVYHAREKEKEKEREREAARGRKG